MNPNLKIPAGGAFDFLSLGALVHRLDPGVIPFRKAAQCQIHISGGEFNVAANLASAFGLKTAIATAMVDYPIGDLAAERVRAMGVQPFYKTFVHDGMTGPNLATVYSDRGFGARPPVVFYNRANEAAALLQRGDFDWKKIFASGVRWFHSGGIFASLSSGTSELIIEGMQTAKKAGAVVSFDVNYREKLWAARGGRKAASRVLHRIAECTDVLFGDIELLLDEKTGGSERIADFKPAAWQKTVKKLCAKLPHLKAVSTTLREVHSANRQSWSTVAWVNGKTHQVPVAELDVLDRVGMGDGYAAGFIYGLLAGETPAEAVKLGWAHGALLATSPGDTTMATLEQVRAVARGGSANIQR